MKKTICVIAAAVLALTAAGCGRQKDDYEKKEAVTASPDVVDAVTELEISSESSDENSAAESTAEPEKETKETDSSEAEEEIPEIPPDVRKDDRPYLGAAAGDDFADACFIGASQTVGLSVFGGKVEPDFFAYAGLNIHSVFDKAFVDWTAPIGEDGEETEDEGPYTVLDVLGNKQYGRIYLAFGLNELGGWIDYGQFYDGYIDLILQIRRLQPTAHIYVQSVLPVSIYALDTNRLFTNENIDNFNKQYVKPIADAAGATYLNVNTLFKCTNGYLARDAASDGIHMSAAYCQEWLDMLAYYTPPSGPRADRPLPTDDPGGSESALPDGLPEQILPPILPEQIIPDLDSSETEQPDENEDEWYGGNDDYWYDDGYGYGYDDYWW